MLYNKFTQTNNRNDNITGLYKLLNYETMSNYETNNPIYKTNQLGTIPWSTKWTNSNLWIQQILTKFWNERKCAALGKQRDRFYRPPKLDAKICDAELRGRVAATSMPGRP